MKVQKVYDKYKAKEISVEQFLYEVRRDPSLKQYISPVNSAEDVITILKNKGIIVENTVPSTVEKFDPLKIMKEYQDEEEKNKYDEIEEKYGNPEILDILKKNDYLGFDIPGEAINAILLDKNWATTFDLSNDPDDVSKLQAWRSTIVKKPKPASSQDVKQNTPVNEEKKKKEEKAVPVAAQYKKKKLTADDVNYYEFTKGWKFELDLDKDHIGSHEEIKKAKEKAIKNLSKDPAYYSNLFAQTTSNLIKKDKKTNKKKVKAKGDQTELVDKENQMKAIKGKNPDKANVKGTLGNSERAKTANPKGVKISKLKESIKGIVKKLLKESSINNHVEAMKAMAQMAPEKLAELVLNQYSQLTSTRKEVAAKVLGKAVAEGNKDKKVIEAFHKLNDENLKEENQAQIEQDVKNYMDSLKKELKKRNLENHPKYDKLLKQAEKDYRTINQDIWNDDKDYSPAWEKKLNNDGIKEEINPEKDAEGLADLLLKQNDGSAEKAKKVVQRKLMDIKAAINNGKDVEHNKKSLKLFAAIYKKLSGSVHEPVKADPKTFSANETKEEFAGNFDTEPVKDPDDIGPLMKKTKEAIKNLTGELRNNPNNKDVKEELEFLKKIYKHFNVEESSENIKEEEIRNLKKGKKYYYTGGAINFECEFVGFQNYKGKYAYIFKMTDPEWHKKDELMPLGGLDIKDYIEPFDEHETNEENITKVSPAKGKMHKLLGVKDGETISSKYKTGEALYNALERRTKDHGKAMKMLAYAANIHKGEDIFDSALHYGKEHNPNAKEEVK